MEFRFFLWLLGSGRCPSGETSKFCFSWAPGEPEMIFKSPDQAPGQLRIFFRSTTFYMPERANTYFHVFKKSNLQNDLNIPLHQKAAHRNFIINGFSFAEFCVTRAKLHFGEFSNLTFQAVSWSLRCFSYVLKSHVLKILGLKRSHMPPQAKPPLRK